ncbi:MAG: Nudix family hydrolase [gamma proteobacterium symbiont of Lucinoma myriamae]|nr:Nudix family hydrolase [gamma proteobacterium symbiont of Lucinoma myriamae]MCU7818877.1 Nudix family hydrolase [gamma proteobacterium symbiont of Lucinoma myriamae]MCU7831048.1 Nudix family hydrolase [gamma proteobacterium symbiont of Lucinoma myriamae]
MPNIEPDNNNKNNNTVVHVAVAVIVKGNRVLISKRAKNVHQGGLWEFPGGKVDPGESIEQALIREIKEELGIEVKKTRPLIKLIHHYPDKSVLLDTLIISQFSGRQYQINDGYEKQPQQGLEGQTVKWVKLNDLTNYSFPLANKPIINALHLPDSYLISPDPFSEKPDSQYLTQFLDEFSHSCDYHQVIQLRIKSFNNAQLNKVLKHACEIAQKKQVRLLLNSSMCFDDDILYACSGIHLTSIHLYDDDFIAHYRTHFAHKMIAASCHCRQDIERANELELDFIVISPVKQTTSHPNQAPIGWEQFKTLTDDAKIPVFALGGMKPGDIKEAQSYGAQGIAAISSLWKASVNDTQDKF